MGKIIILSLDSKKKEQLLKVLNTAKMMHVPGKYYLMTEPWDWVAILQWIEDHGLCKHNPKRPAFQSFEEWLRENEVVCNRAPYSAYEMSLGHRRIEGMRHPWLEITQHDAGMIRRWRILYQKLNDLWEEALSCDTK